MAEAGLPHIKYADLLLHQPSKAYRKIWTMKVDLREERSLHLVMVVMNVIVESPSQGSFCIN